MKGDEDFDLSNIEYEEQLEEIRGENGKKPKMSLLNQKKINRYEMDELFADQNNSSDFDVDYEEEF